MSFICPHCQKSGISFFNKLYVSPRFPAVCSHCNGESGVADRQALMSLVPLAIGTAASLSVNGRMAALACFAAGLAIYLLIFMKRVPLIPRQASPARSVSRDQ